MGSESASCRSYRCKHAQAHIRLHPACPMLYLFVLSLAGMAPFPQQTHPPMWAFELIIRLNGPRLLSR